MSRQEEYLGRAGRTGQCSGAFKGTDRGDGTADWTAIMVGGGQEVFGTDAKRLRGKHPTPRFSQAITLNYSALQAALKLLPAGFRILECDSSRHIRWHAVGGGAML